MHNALMPLGLLLAVSIGLSACCVFEAHKTQIDRAIADQDAAGAMIREDFVQASGSMKVAIAEYYATNGRLPQYNLEAGLHAPNEYRGKTLLSASVSSGVIAMIFNEKSGMSNGRIDLIPDVSHVATMGMQWRCETTNYPRIKRYLPMCDYVSR